MLVQAEVVFLLLLYELALEFCLCVHSTLFACLVHFFLHSDLVFFLVLYFDSSTMERLNTQKK